MPRPVTARPASSPHRARIAAGLMLAAALAGCGRSAKTPVAAQPARPAQIADDADVGRATLKAAIDPLFDDPAQGETRALVVMHDGRIVAERYAAGYGPDSPLLGWSMTKSVNAVLIGMLVADGRLSLNAPAPVEAWSQPGDPRGRIRLSDLLHMASGLEHVEGLDADGKVPIWEGDTARMLFLDGADNMASFAERHPLADPPGTRFNYSTATSVILADIGTRALTDSADPAVRRRAMGEFMAGRLFEPLGMTSALPEFDPAGTFIGGSMLHATARDWAKFGEFLRRGGRSPDGRQLVPARWIAFMRRPSPAQPAYGAQLWLNRQPSGAMDPVLFPDLAPASVFACLGHVGQYVIVSPEQRLTVVRLGKTDDARLDPVRRQLGRIVSLFPRRQPGS